ncbi:MAG: ComF family protein [Acidobacteria bacterium]|nr:ComF family protein [Acidobacteriota bacterium]
MQPYDGLECEHCGLFLGSTLGLHGTELCGLCRRASYSFDQARSFAEYDGVLGDLIRRFKYDAWFPLAKPLARCLQEASGRFATGSKSPIQFDLILPVPLHRNRQRKRGFNQAQLLAENLSRLNGVRVGGRDCVRMRDTPPQTGLRGAERRKNVRGAFAVPEPGRVKGASILLIDDVLTTGATLDACAAALREAGAAQVRALTLARARPGARDIV